MNDPQRLWNKCLNEMKEFKMKNEIEIPDLFSEKDCDMRGVRMLAPRRWGWDGPTEPPRCISIEEANARFREWALGLPKIYAETTSENACWLEVRNSHDNAVALLAFPQEIKKAECVHEPRLSFDSLIIAAEIKHKCFTHCLKCGQRLIAKWEAADV